MWFDRVVPWRHYRDSKPRLPKKVFLEQFAELISLSSICSWTGEALAMESPCPWASIWHRWTQKDRNRSRVWPESSVCPAALPTLQGPPGASTDVSSSTPAVYASPRTRVLPLFQRCVLLLAWPQACNECLGVNSWVGTTQPLCQKDTQVLKLFGVSWSPWCCCPPFGGSAGSADSSVPPSATQGYRWLAIYDVPTGKVLLPVQGFDKIFVSTVQMLHK